MRRAYIEVQHPADEAFSIARAWPGEGRVTVMGYSTSGISDFPWLETSGLPIGVTSAKHSRFGARPRGTVICWQLDLGEVLEIEHRNELRGVVVVGAHEAHAPWVTAHEAEHLAGREIAGIPQASRAVVALVAGLSRMPAVHSQGLIDSRERSAAVQALTYFHDHGIKLVGEQLIVEALRHDWPGRSSLELADLAQRIGSGSRLRSGTRLRPEVIAEWARA